MPDFWRRADLVESKTSTPYIKLKNESHFKDPMLEINSNALQEA